MTATLGYQNLTEGQQATWSYQLHRLRDYFEDHAARVLRDRPVPGITLNVRADITTPRGCTDPQLDVHLLHDDLFRPGAAVRSPLFFVSIDKIRDFALYRIGADSFAAAGQWVEVLPSMVRAFEETYPATGRELISDQVDYLNLIHDMPDPYKNRLSWPAP